MITTTKVTVSMEVGGNLLEKVCIHWVTIRCYSYCEEVLMLNMQAFYYLSLRHVVQWWCYICWLFVCRSNTLLHRQKFMGHWFRPWWLRVCEIQQQHLL